MEFKNRLTFEESILMVQEVADTVFDTNTEIGMTTYVPYLRDYATRLAIAKYYGEYSLTNDNDIDYGIAMGIKTDTLLESNTIDKDQYSGIETAIVEMINFKKEELHKTNIIVASQFDELIPAVMKVINTIDEKLSAVDTKKLNKQLGSLNMKKLMDEYTKSDRFTGNTNSIINSKNVQIKELQEKLNKYTASNVVAMPTKE